MKWLRKALGMNIIDRIRNGDIKIICGYSRSLLKLLGQSILKWFGHMTKMDGGRLNKKIQRQFLFIKTNKPKK